MKKIPLNSGYELKFSDKKYVIKNVAGDGAFCTAYVAEYHDKKIISRRILKEFYPKFLKIKRKKSGELVPKKGFAKRFERDKKIFLESGITQNKIRFFDELANKTPPLNNYFEANNTVYLDVTSFVGEPMSNLFDRPLCEKIKLIKSAAKLVEAYHGTGFLCPDIKPENFFSASRNARYSRVYRLRKHRKKIGN